MNNEGRTAPTGSSGITKACPHDYVFLRQDRNKDLFYCRHCLQYEHGQPPRLPDPPSPPPIDTLPNPAGPVGPRVKMYVDGPKSLRPQQDKAIHGPDSDK